MSRLGGHTHTHTVETSIGRGPSTPGSSCTTIEPTPIWCGFSRNSESNARRAICRSAFRVNRRAMEYSSRGLRGLFANPGNLVRPAHYRFLSEILRFNRESTEFLKRPELSEIDPG